MKLTDQPVSEFLLALRSSSAVPGGGSAAALAGAAGASLLAMVAGMPKHRAQSDEEVADLRAAAERSSALAGTLTTSIDDDSEAYGRVMAAYRLPKASDVEKAERSAAIQAALRTATDVPLTVMRRSVEALASAATVGRLCNPNASSDVGVAVELLSAACRGARLNVEINLGHVKDTGYVEQAREEARTLGARCDDLAADAPRPLP